MTDGGIICPDCANKRIDDWNVDNGYDFDTAMEQAVADWKEEHGSVPDRWKMSDLYRDVEEEFLNRATDALDLEEIIQYTLDENFSEDGCSCDDCCATLVEPYMEDEEESEEDE
jgi:hypothetical protein